MQFAAEGQILALIFPDHGLASASVRSEVSGISACASCASRHAAAVAAVMGKAKLLNIGEQQSHNPQDCKAARSMQDIGRKLLQSVGFGAPYDASIAAAIEANDAFVTRLEAIRDAAQGLTIDQDC